MVQKMSQGVTERARKKKNLINSGRYAINRPRHVFKSKPCGAVRTDSINTFADPAFLIKSTKLVAAELCELIGRWWSRRRWLITEGSLWGGWAILERHGKETRRWRFNEGVTEGQTSGVNHDLTGLDEPPLKKKHRDTNTQLIRRWTCFKGKDIT